MNRPFMNNIYGCYRELAALIEKAGLSLRDRIISLGDMLDRGPDSKPATDFFIKNEQACSLLGNHEHKHLLCHQGIVPPSTAQEITRQEFSRTGYEGLIQWLRKLPVYMDTEPALLIHGFLEPGVPLDRQKKQVLLGTRNGEQYLKKQYNKPWYDLCDPEKPIIAGHRDISQKRVFKK